jgi:predicted nucleic-acid-binding protein
LALIAWFMAALDTNILVRFLVRDDETQIASVQKRIRSALSAGETLFVPITVALELKWVLRSNFKYSKDDVTHTLSSLLATSELSFESESAFEVGLALYKKGNADFSDCIHTALAHAAGESPLWTFDLAASKTDGAKLLA